MANSILSNRFTNANPSHHLGLHVTDPTNAGLASTELTSVIAPSYTRQPVVWSSPVSRAVTNTNTIQWLALPVVSIGYLGVWNSPTGGSLLAVLACDEPFEVTVAGGSIRLAPETLAVVMGGSPGGRVTPDGGLFPEF
jgi:hypothetical protein